MLGIFGGAIAATYWLGTDAYRYSVFVAPRTVPSFTFSSAYSSLKQPLVTYSYFLLPLLIFVARPWKRSFEIMDLLRAAAFVSLVGGCVAMGKAGAGDNYLFETFVAGTTLLLMELFSNPGRTMAIGFILLGCIQPAAQLAGWLGNRETFGIIEISSQQEFEQAQALQQRVAQLKKPLLTTDETMSLPWNSSDNSYPANVFDLVFVRGGANHYADGGPIGLIERGEIPSLMLRTNDTDLRRAAKEKYSRVEEEMHQHFHYDLYAVNPAGK